MMDNEDIILKLSEAESRSKSNSHRLDEVEKRQNDFDKMLTSIALIAQRQDTMDSDIQEIKSDVKSLASKSGRRWDAIIEKILLGLAAALAAYIAARLFG